MKNQKQLRIKDKAKLGLIDTRRFYRLLAQNSNYMEEEAVEQVYMGLVKLIAKELRAHEFIRLPFLTDFYLIDCQPSQRLAGKTKGGKPIIARSARRKSLRMYPHRRLRDYFAQLHKAKDER